VDGKTVDDDEKMARPASIVTAGHAVGI